MSERPAARDDVIRDEHHEDAPADLRIAASEPVVDQGRGAKRRRWWIMGLRVVFGLSERDPPFRFAGTEGLCRCGKG